VPTSPGSQPTRIFGTAREHLADSVEHLLDKVATHLALGERDRLLTLALEYGLKTPSQPIRLQSQTPVPQLLETPAPRLTANVSRIHQVYGLYRDGLPMNPLFCESRRRWEQVAASMGYIYIAYIYIYISQYESQT